MATQQAAQNAIAELNAAQTVARGGAAAASPQRSWSSFLLSPVRIVGGAAGLAYSVLSSQIVLPLVGKATGLLAEKSWMPGKVSRFLNTATAVANTPSIPVGELSQHLSSMTGSARVAHVAGKVHTVTAAHANRLLSGYRGQAMLERAAQQPLAMHLLAGASMAGQGYSLIGSFTGGLSELRKMQQDLSGKPASLWSVLFGSHLHPQVQAARKDIISARALLSSGLNAAGIFGTFYIYYLDRNALKAGTARQIIKMLALTGGTSMAASMVASSLTAVSASRQLRQYFATYGQAPAEVYEALIGGFVPNAPSALVQKFAQQCADEKLPPKDTLLRIGEFKHTLAAQHAHAQAQPSALKPVTIGGKVIAPRLAQDTGYVGMLRSPAQVIVR